MCQEIIDTKHFAGVWVIMEGEKIIKHDAQLACDSISKDETQCSIRTFLEKLSLIVIENVIQ
jgi:hypothetical protein